MNIIFFGGHKWFEGAWFRKQQFALRLSQNGHKIFYVESSVSMIRKKKHDSNDYLKTKIKEVNNNLFVITPSALFPFPQNFFLRKFYNKKLFNDIKKFLDKKGINEYIVWFNEIQFSSYLDKINCYKIFDLADDRPYYSILAGNVKEYKTLLKYLKLAYLNSNISIVSALKIKEKYQNLCSSEIIVIPNGHNIKINKSNNFEIPSEILQLNGPIIGFIGTLFRFIDEQLLEFIISKRPNYNFVFVGHTESNFPIDSIKKYNNVHLLGPKEKSEIPKYINSFDLCLNPFKVHEVNDSVSPVKVFEYLAMKKLIISTNMYSLRKEKVADYIIFADNYEQYLNEIDKTLTLTSKINNVPDSILENYSWDNLFAALVSKINSRNEIKL